MPAASPPEGLNAPIVPKILRAISAANVWVYRATGGLLWSKWRIGAAFPWGVPVCLLTTTGRKTGAKRTTPLLFVQDGDRVVLAGSQGGLAKHPLWYLNVCADPEVAVQIGRTETPMRARVAQGDERAALWAKLVAMYADFARYQSWTDREIPVVICEPRPALGP